MNPYRQEFIDSMDRVVGSMMSEMSLDFQLLHGRICSTTNKFYNRCGHVSTSGVEKRVMDCCLCAGETDPTKKCVLVPRVDENEELCPYCRTVEASRTARGGRGIEDFCREEDYRKKLVEERERNARKREEREAERRSAMWERSEPRRQRGRGSKTHREL